MQTAIDIHDLRFAPAGEVILDGVDLRVEQGEFVCLLGPSGAGKSTTLRLLGGLMEGSGDIEVYGESPHHGWRRLAYVFQSPRLVRWRSAIDNVMLGMELRDGRGDKAARRERARAVLERVGLADLADRPAHLLSGGEQQRVAIARALAVEPDVLLMDEPFSALDVRTRTELRRQMVELWQETGLTVVFVTHDVDEALALGARAVVLSRKPTRVLADVRIDLPHPRDRESAEADVHREAILAAFGDSRAEVEQEIEAEGEEAA
ncbi:MAG TPA: ABC transporter ATP-binding protein [Conexibacter sp.]|nr:ABC transporter ATP-binding protein [Conexibacter sp.]